MSKHPFKKREVMTLLDEDMLKRIQKGEVKLYQRKGKKKVRKHIEYKGKVY